MGEINTEVIEYINQFNEDIKKRLLIIRKIAFDLLPDATEDIKYRMPTIMYHGNLFHYAAFKNHIGVYPLPEVLEELKKELNEYSQGKGSIQFKNDEPLPIEIITKIIKARIYEKNEEIAKKATQKK